MDSGITQDVVSSNPQTMSKFDNTKRMKPWEVFKKMNAEEDKQENFVQYDSFRDKCAQNQNSGAGFTALLNNTIQQDNNFQIKLNKNQYYQNLKQNKKLFGMNNYQNPKPNRQGSNQPQAASKSKDEQNQHQPRFNNIVHNNFQKQNNFRGNQDEGNPKANQFQTYQDGNRSNKYHFNNRFHQREDDGSQKENTFNLNTQNEGQQQQQDQLSGKDNEEIAKAKFFERKQRKANNMIQQQAQRALRREEGENIPSDDENPLQKYNLSDSSSELSDSEEGKKRQQAHLTSSQKKKRTGLSRRRLKICGSWVRVCDNQKFDKPPSYKDYLGALTNAKGQRPLQNLVEREEELCEVNKELAQDAEDGELKALADLEDGEIKMQEDSYFLKSRVEDKVDHEDAFFQFPNKKQPQQKFNKNKNFMHVNPTKILNTLRRSNLNEEEDDTTQKKKQKIPTKEELLEQETQLLEKQSKEEAGGSDPIQLLQRMNQLGNEVYKNKSGNNFQMQQTLATQQDLFLQQYFNKAKHKGQNNNQEPNAQDGTAPQVQGQTAQQTNGNNQLKKEKRFDVRNYQIDMEKNMVDNKVQITEGLRNLAKIQNELYISGMKKKNNKQNKEITNSTIFSSGSGSKINKMIQQDSTEKELRDATQRLSAKVGMKDLQSKLNFDQINAHPLLLQKEKQNEHFNQALSKYEEELNKAMKPMKTNYNFKKEEITAPKQVTEKIVDEKDNEANEEKNQNEGNDEDMNFEDEDLNEFEKFNEEYLKEQEKMLEDIQKKNKEKVNEIKNSKSIDLGLGLDFGIDGGEQKEEELNPLERMIQDELDKNRQDKQQQNYRLMELQKLHDNQHMQHLHLLAKSTTNDKKPSFNQQQNQNQNHNQNHNHNHSDNPSAKISQSQLHAMANNPTSRDASNRMKRSRFSEIPTLPTQLVNYEAFAQMDRLTQIQSQRNMPQEMELEPPTITASQQNGIQNLAQLQHQLFSKNQQTIAQLGIRDKMEIEPSSSYNNRSSKFSSFPHSHQPTSSSSSSYHQNDNDHHNRHSYNSHRNDRRHQQEEQQGQQEQYKQPQKIERKVSFDKDVAIPEMIKNKEKELRPEVYEKIVVEYIKKYKGAKDEMQFDRIKDPRLRARAAIQLEEKSQQFAEQLLNSNQDKINNYIPLACDDHSLPLPSKDDNSGDKRKSSLLSFQVETTSFPETQNKDNESDDKVVYNYKVLKSDRTFITQEKNLIEKQNALSFLQDSSSGPSASQMVNLSKKESDQNDKNTETGELNEMFKNDREVRYFKENNTLFCFKCNQNGHIAKWCTAATSENQEKGKCLFCMGDHTKEYCTSYVCFKCYLVGHRIKDCAFEQSMDQTRCRVCRKKGHTIRQCGSLNIDVVMKNYDYYSMGETICLTCGELGHVNCYIPRDIAYDGLYKLDKVMLDRIQ